MRILLARAGNTRVELYRAFISWKGLKYSIKESEVLNFDGRVSAPKKHLMRRVVTWINSRSDSGVKVVILPGKTLTPLLYKKVRERTLCKIIRPRHSDPEEFLQHLARIFRDSLSTH